MEEQEKLQPELNNKSSEEEPANNLETVSKVPQLLPYQWKKGQSGNPSGRPKETLKDYAKKKLAGMSEEEKNEYLVGLNKMDIWKMAEGNPDTKVDPNPNMPEGAAVKIIGEAFLDKDGNMLVSKKTSEKLKDHGESSRTTEQVQETV